MEDFAITDYSVVDVTIFTEAAVMGQISEAERWVNEYCKQSFTAGAAPDGVKTATLNMARFYMSQQMLEKDFIEELPTPLEAVIEVCKKSLKNNVLGIDYSSSLTDFDLRNRAG